MHPTGTPKIAAKLRVGPKFVMFGTFKNFNEKKTIMKSKVLKPAGKISEKSVFRKKIILRHFFELLSRVRI